MKINEDISVRKQSVDEKYSPEAVNFIKEILADQMKNQVGIENQELFGTFPSVFIQDATRFKLPIKYKEQYPGFSNQIGQSSGMSIQFVYDAKQSKINYIHIHSALENDSNYANELDWLTPDSLLIRDLGYFSMKSLKNIKRKNAKYISRLKPKTALFKKVGEEYIRIDMKKLLQKMKKQSILFIDEEFYISTSEKEISRVCIFLIPEEVREARIRKNKKVNSGKKHQCTDEFSIWSAFNIFITNVDPSQHSIDQIAKLYKIRWQIELIFKTWKSFYRIDRIKNMKIIRIECYMYASLLYLFLNWQIYNLVQKVYSDIYISHMKFAKILILNKEKIRDIIVADDYLKLEEIINKIDKICVQLERKNGKISSEEIASSQTKELPLKRRFGMPDQTS